MIISDSCAAYISKEMNDLLTFCRETRSGGQKEEEKVGEAQYNKNSTFKNLKRGYEKNVLRSRSVSYSD